MPDVKPAPSMDSPTCSVAFSAAPGAVTTGASFTAATLMVTESLPSSELPSPVRPGSEPTLPPSFTVTVSVVAGLGVSLPLR